MPRKKAFTNPVSEIRRALGLTQTRFGELLGISKSYLQKLERGDRPVSDTLAMTMLISFGVLPASIIKKRGEPQHVYRVAINGLTEQISAWQTFIKPLNQDAEQAFISVVAPKLCLLIRAAGGKGKGLVLLALLDAWIDNIVRELGLGVALARELREQKDAGNEVPWVPVIHAMGVGEDAEVSVISTNRAAKALQSSGSTRNSALGAKEAGAKSPAKGARRRGLKLALPADPTASL